MKPESRMPPYLLLLLSEGLFRDLAPLPETLQLLSQPFFRIVPCGLSFRHLHGEQHKKVRGHVVRIFSAREAVLLRRFFRSSRSPTTKINGSGIVAVYRAGCRESVEG